MFRIILLGVLAALFFSSTFVLNRAMSLEGGHWVWSASLRYFWMLVMLFGWLAATGKGRLAADSVRLFARHWVFWTVAGSVGFGVFYALITFSSVFAPGWVVAVCMRSCWGRCPCWWRPLPTPSATSLSGRRGGARKVFFRTSTTRPWTIPFAGCCS
jgi:hypothetical protein